MDSLIRSSRYVGEANVPAEVKRRRRFVYDAMRRLGTPVVLKHMWNDDDAERGIAQKSPNFEDPYGQTRNEDPLSYGIGYESVERSDNEWLSPKGAIVKSVTSPGAGYTRAAKWRGFGQGYLTYLIEPDVSEDLFKLSSGGALIQIQTATVQAPWWPEINDNDLLIHVVIDGHGRVVEAQERFQAKQVNVVSIRGRDRMGRREYTEAGGNRFVVNQTFEMTLVPSTSILQKVEFDR